MTKVWHELIFIILSHAVIVFFLYPSFYSFISFFLENDKSWHDIMNTVVFVCHLVALDLLLTGLFSSILFIPYTADPQTTTHTHINLSFSSTDRPLLLHNRKPPQQHRFITAPNNPRIPQESRRWSPITHCIR